MAVPNLDGVYCFPWPDTGQISSVQYYDCAALGKTSVAMSLEKFEEFKAAAAGTVTETPPAVDLPPYALSVADGAELAWLIGGAWAAVYAVRLVVDQLRPQRISDGDQ